MAEVNSRNFEVTISSEGVAGPAGPVGPIGPQGPKGEPGGFTNPAIYHGNLNDLFVSGLYLIGWSGATNPANNTPIAHEGVLEVVHYPTASMTTQVYNSVYTSGVWTRGKVGTASWSAWKKLAFAGNVDGGAVVGVGSPEGVHSGSVGLRYIDSASTNGATEWIKTTSSGTSGWKVVYGDTGVRRLAEWSSGAFTYGGLAEPTTWKPHDVASGYVRLRRNGDTVEVGIAMVQATQASPGTIVSLPIGFRPTMTQRIVSEKWNATGVNNGAATGFHIEPTGYFGRGGNSSIQTGDYYVSINTTFVTRDPWPTTLPGVAG